MRLFRKRKQPVRVGDDPSRIYYVYVWYAQCPDEPDWWIYAGKGSNGRVHRHMSTYRSKLKNPRSKLDPKERLFLWAEDRGCLLGYHILYKNIDETMAFALEREVIMANGGALLRRGNVGMPRK